MRLPRIKAIVAVLLLQVAGLGAVLPASANSGNKAGAGDTASLLEALMDRNSDVREEAARALGQAGDTRAVEPLLIAVGDPYDGVRDAAADALEELGEPLGQLIRKSLAGSQQSMDELGKRNDPRAVAPLVRALGAYRMEVRVSAGRALMAIGDTRAIEPLIAAMQNEYGPVREAAAWALVKIGDGRTVEPMIKALSDPEVSVRAAAAYALGRIGDRRAVLPLVSVLADWNGVVREAAAWSLGKFGDPVALEPLVRSLGDVHGIVREAAAYSLGTLANQRAVPPLIRSLHDPTPKVRLAAVWSLGRLGDRRAVDPLVEAVADDDPKVGEAASQALKKLGEPLGRLIREGISVSGKAAEALIAAKDPRAVVSLVRFLRNPDGRVRRAAAMLLGRIGDRRALHDLVEMAGGWNLRDRLAAARALLILEREADSASSFLIFQIMATPASLTYSAGIVAVLVLLIRSRKWLTQIRAVARNERTDV
jgi:HEAT repeat protein